MKHIKKTISIILAAVLILCVSAGCGQQKETVLPVHVEGSIFGGNSDDSLGLDLKFSPVWITEGNNAAYSRELAAFSAIVSADTYFRTKDLDRGTQNRVLVDDPDRGEYDQTALLRALGFTDVQVIESFKAGSYETDQNDSVTMTLAYLNDRDRYDCYVIAIRGCFSSAEWNSIFDVGDPSPAYTDLTGEHPEWTDTALLKGLGVAANRAMEFADDFLASHDDPARKNCVLITGHSRGGALAQIVGARFEKDPDVKSSTYTFNAAPVTNRVESAGDYRTIFNVFDSSDFFADCLPFADEPLARYGVTVSLDISGCSELRQNIAAIKGIDDYRSMREAQASEYRTLFSRLFPDRVSLYDPHEIARIFDDEAAASAELETCRTLIGAEAGLGLEPFCSVSEVEKNTGGRYEFRIRYCRAALLQSIGRILAYGQSAADAVQVLFAEEPDICAIADLIMANAADITGGHRLLNSYALAGYSGTSKG